MRILIVAHGIPSPIGQIHLHTLLPHLTPEHDVSIVCFDHNAELVTADDLAKRTGARITTVPLRVRPFRTRAASALLRGVPIAVATHESRALARTIRQVTAQERFDVVLIEQMALAPYARLMGDVPVVQFPVDCVTRLKEQLASREPSFARRLDLRLTRAFERDAYARSAGVIFVSSEDARYAIAHGVAPESRTHVVPLGVDTERFVPKEGREIPERVLFFGNLQNPSNEDAALWFHQEIWPEVRKVHPGARLVLAGQGPSPSIRALARTDPTVSVTGFIEDLPSVLHEAAVVVSPLRIGTGVKNRMLQSMSAGKAIVATPLSADGLDIQDDEHALIARDGDAFGKAVSTLLLDPSRRMRLGRAARAHVVSRFAAQASAARLVDVLRNAASAKVTP